MGSVLRSVETGEWLTAARMTAYARIILLVGTAGIIWLLVTSSSGLDRFGRPIGTDFISFWTAGQLAVTGAPEAAYNPERLHETQRSAFGDPDLALTPWFYPPIFLILVSLLALMPYGVALAVWLGGTLAAYLAVMRRIAPYGPTLLLSFAYPAVFVNITHGQNGYFSAAIFGGALLLLDRRPMLAGGLIALLTFKPQLGVLFPLVLAATGRWRAFAGACAGVAVLAGASLVLFGTATWQAMFDQLPYIRSLLLEHEGIGWEKMQSLFAALRHFGLGLTASYAAHITLTLAVAATTIWIWRCRVDFSLKASALVTGALLIPPHIVEYDMVVLALAIAWLAGRGLKSGFMPYEKTLLAAVWFAPLCARAIAGQTLLPVGFLAIFCLFALIVRRVLHERSLEASGEERGARSGFQAGAV